MTKARAAKRIEEVVLYDTYGAYEGAFKEAVYQIQSDIQNGEAEEYLDGSTLEILEEIDTLEEIAKMDDVELEDKLESYRDDIVTDMHYEDYYHMQKENTEYVLGELIKAYEAQHKTTVHSFMLKGSRYSHYGSIGGNGRSGSIMVNTVEDLFYHGGEDTIIKVNLDREIEVISLDHDGKTTYYVSFITEKEHNRAAEARDFHDEIEYHTLELFHDKKPTQFTWKALKNVVGIRLQ